MFGVKFTVLIMGVAATVLPVMIHAFEFLHSQDEYISVATSLPRIHGVADIRYLSHRLINVDLEKGIVSRGTSELAFGNTERYFSEVKKSCPSNINNREYIACANRILSQHFYYKPSNDVSTAWSTHYSDCDLNVYLLLDVMKMSGRYAEIIYAPNHAFIAYQDEHTGTRFYWETTKNHNSGSIADLQDPFYKKNFARFYYSPFNEDFAEALYPVLVVREIPDSVEREKTLKSVHEQHADNPLAQDVWYQSKETVTREDARIIAGLLQTDTTSVTKITVLADYLMTHHQQGAARHYLDKITDDVCGDACLRLKKETSYKYKTISWLRDNLIHFGFKFPVELIAISINETLFIYALIILCCVLDTVAVKNTIKKGIESLSSVRNPGRRVSG